MKSKRRSAAAQELKQLYEQYRQDFESKFKDVMKQDRYKHLMLRHEELLTIRDFGPEVATLNEQLYFYIIQHQQIVTLLRLMMQ